mmetsp:Transcript_36349/g.109876  ORF Transcript_36349/g.109876 Transcript_36349/m.109876 type:complete len:331 (-) Transcript_36349:1347-2339(-)
MPRGHREDLQGARELNGHHRFFLVLPRAHHAQDLHLGDFGLHLPWERLGRRHHYEAQRLVLRAEMAPDELLADHRSCRRGHLGLPRGCLGLLRRVAARPLAGPAVAGHPGPEVAAGAPPQCHRLRGRLPLGLLGALPEAEAVGVRPVGRPRVRGPALRGYRWQPADLRDLLGGPCCHARGDELQIRADFHLRYARQQGPQGIRPWLPQELGARHEGELCVALHARRLHRRRGLPPFADDEGSRLEHDVRHEFARRLHRPAIAAGRLHRGGPGAGVRLHHVPLERLRWVAARVLREPRGHILRVLRRLGSRRRRHGAQAPAERPEEHVLAH